MWKTVRCFLKKLKIAVQVIQPISLLDVHWRELKVGSQRDICTSMVIATLFTIAKKWKQLKSPLVDEQISKYGIRRKEILQYATTWTNSEGIMLSKICQSQEDKYYVSPFIWGQDHTDKKWNRSCLGRWVGGNGELLFNGTEFQFCKMKRVLERDGGKGCTTMWMYLIPLNCTLKNG